MILDKIKKQYDKAKHHQIIVVELGSYLNLNIEEVKNTIKY